jgi:TonB family protein
MCTFISFPLTKIPVVLVGVALVFAANGAYPQNDTTIWLSASRAPVPDKKLAASSEKVVQTADRRFRIDAARLVNGKWIPAPWYELIGQDDSTFLVLIKPADGITDTLLRCYSTADSGYAVSEFRKEILIARGYSRLIAPLIKEGLWVYYRSQTGGLDRDETYMNNTMTESRYYDEETDNFITDVCLKPEVPASFQGGDEKLREFLMQELVYPARAAEKKVEGTVMVSFIVMEDGSLKRIEVLREVDLWLDEEALRVVRQSDFKWVPAQNQGIPVRSIFVLPVVFRI